MAKEKVTLKWSKKENDWIIQYPEWGNRNARILGINLLSMVQDFEGVSGNSLRDLINNCKCDDKSFNADSFTIIVRTNEKKEE